MCYRTCAVALAALSVLRCGDDNDSGGRGFTCMDNAHPQGNNCVCNDGFDWCSDDPNSPNFEVCCRDQTSAVCGDGTCNGSENSATCPGDCGTTNACVTSGSHAACAFDEFCYERTCTGVFGRRWAVSLIAGAVGTNDPDGAAWDVGGGAPDLFACVRLDDEGIGCTSTVTDSFSAQWNQAAEVILQSGGVLELELWDADVTVDDLIITFELSGTDDLVSIARAYDEQFVSTYSQDARISLTWSLGPLF